MQVHYLEWSNQWVTVSSKFTDEGYLGWPDEQSDVKVIDDQSMFTPGEITYNGLKYFDEETQQELFMNYLVPNAGNGSLTSGHLDLRKSYKTFGTLG